MVVSDTLFRKFERAFTGEIINPCDWEKKEQIGKGEYFLEFCANIIATNYKLCTLLD